jgi:hypothetical protein
LLAIIVFLTDCPFAGVQALRISAEVVLTAVKKATVFLKRETRVSVVNGLLANYTYCQLAFLPVSGLYRLPL